MSTIGRLTALIGSVIVATAGAYAAPAAAQATRTWVSGVGDDANPCSRTAPCKTYAGAISKTAAGGEINCIDPGAYGAVTITKAIAIDCSDVEAGTLASGTNGITINAGVNDVVFLKGLDIHGGSTGLNGVRFLAGAAVHIEDTVIRSFLSANGQGVLFAPSGASELYITNSIISNNGVSGAGGGVLIQPTGTGSAKVVIDNTLIQNNFNVSLKVDTTGNTGSGVNLTVNNTQLTGAAGGITGNVPVGAAAARILVIGSIVSNNNYGIIMTGAGASGQVSGTTITGNNTGLLITGGTLASYGDNLLDGNGTNGAFTGAILAKK